MTFFDDDWPPWKRFQARIKLAVSRTADEHESVQNLLHDLEVCEMFLREPHLTLDEFQAMGSPAADELCNALEEHAAEDPVRYDGICAANVVLAAINGIEQADIGD